MKLSLSGAHLDDIIRHARGSFPNEACGILAGRDGKVFKLYRMTNAEKAEDRYSFSAGEQFEVQKRIRSDGFEMVGIYHSHPHTRAYPSLLDIKLSAHAGCSYLIISLADKMPEIRSFKIASGSVSEEVVDVT
jgi:proteasome lid subunit RPN8/RPN11